MASIKAGTKEIYLQPEWLNIDFLVTVLCHYENSTEIQVKHFDIISQTPKPFPTGCLTLKTTVEYQKQSVNKTKSMLIKAMPESEEHIKEFLGESYFFNTEFDMFTDVIPKFEKILRETGDNTVLCRRCLYHTTNPRKVLVLEDLEPDGYKVPHDGDMNLEEVKTAYYKLAKWHAVSHKISLENPHYFDKFRYDFFHIPDLAEKGLVSAGGLHLFIELLDSVPSLREYKPYFEAMRGNFLEKCIAMSEEYSLNPHPDGIYVLCHGDYSFINFILKNNPETGQLEDVLLSCMAASHMGSIANDLIYATFMLLDQELRDDHRDEIFYFYMSTFVQTLKKIGFKGHLPKIAEMKEQIRQRKHLIFYILTTVRPMFRAWHDDSTDKEKLLCSADYCMQFYRKQEYVDELHKWLPRWLHEGLFED